MNVTCAISACRDTTCSVNSPSRSGAVDSKPHNKDPIMSAHATLLDRPALDLPYVEAELHYLSRMTERPRNYTYDPPPGVPRSNAVHEAHVVPVYDLRGIEAEI